MKLRATNHDIKMFSIEPVFLAYLFANWRSFCKYKSILRELIGMLLKVFAHTYTK